VQSLQDNLDEHGELIEDYLKTTESLVSDKSKAVQCWEVQCDAPRQKQHKLWVGYKRYGQKLKITETEKDRVVVVNIKSI